MRRRLCAVLAVCLAVTGLAMGGSFADGPTGGGYDADERPYGERVTIGQYARMTGADGTPVYVEPSGDAAVAGYTYAGERIVLVRWNDAGDWVYVYYGGVSAAGWMQGQYVQPTGDVMYSDSEYEMTRWYDSHAEEIRPDDSFVYADEQPSAVLQGQTTYVERKPFYRAYMDASWYDFEYHVMLEQLGSGAEEAGRPLRYLDGVLGYAWYLDAGTDHWEILEVMLKRTEVRVESPSGPCNHDPMDPNCLYNEILH